MVQHWGPIPDAALCKARAAYGDTVDQALSKVAARLGDPATLRHCLTTLNADPALHSTIPITLPTLTRRL